MKIAARFLSAVSAGFIASAPIAMIPLSSVGAAEECLTTPKDETPPGKHWYYRSERGSKLHCWYLREEGEAPSHAAAPARRAAPEVAPNRETKVARSAADAHAELPLLQNVVEAGPTTPVTSVDPSGAKQKPSKNAAPETAQSPIVSRSSEPSGVFSSASERPISPSFLAGSAPDKNSDASADTDMTPKVGSVAPAKVETSSTETPASLRILLLATFGAIAVSWLAGSAIMGRLRRRPQRYTALNPPKWPTEEPSCYAGTPTAQEPMPVNSTRPLNIGHKSLGRQRSGLGDNEREIERLLARFANRARVEP
jgi:hypothetical protein